MTHQRSEAESWLVQRARIRSNTEILRVPELEFHGAAREVTGSQHLLHLGEETFLLDCGLFQGRRDETRERNLKFPFRPSELAGVILSHAHIDHSGNLPGLARDKFTGPVYATPATRDLCSVMLPDSAKIQEEDARFWNEKRANGYPPIEPLYTMQDARRVLMRFKAVDYGNRFRVTQNCRATFYDAGHILGSAMMLLEVGPPGKELNNGEGVRILFTGDMGRFDMPILRDPQEPLPQADYLITECTYANRVHADADDMKGRLQRIIQQTYDVGGKVIIPAFSVGRTQAVVYFLSQLIAEKKLPAMPIYVDSPLSTRATDVFKMHPECYDEQAAQQWADTGDVFGNGHVQYITESNDSKALNDRRDPMVIIASSGMCENGRILHHLKNNVEDERNTVAIVGFQAQHTLGRRIVERREEIRIYGRMYKLLCRVEVLNGFSAHADGPEFRRVLAPIAKGLKQAFIVHGEDEQPKAMAELLHELGCPNTVIPAPGERFKVL